MHLEDRSGAVHGDGVGNQLDGLVHGDRLLKVLGRIVRFRFRRIVARQQGEQQAEE